MWIFRLSPLLALLTQSACAEPASAPPAVATEEASGTSEVDPTTTVSAAKPGSGKDDGVVSGQLAPGMDLPVFGSEKRWNLADYVNGNGTGRADGVVVSFMASWCGVCKNSLPTLVELEAEHRARIQFVVVNTDTTSDAQQKEADILKKAGLNVPMAVVDAPTQTAWLGSSKSIPRFVFIDKRGKVMVQDRGFGAKVKPLMPKQIKSLLARADRDAG